MPFGGGKAPKPLPNGTPTPVPEGALPGPKSDSKVTRGSDGASPPATAEPFVAPHAPPLPCDQDQQVVSLKQQVVGRQLLVLCTTAIRRSRGLRTARPPPPPRSRSSPVPGLQGCLAHKKHPPP